MQEGLFSQMRLCSLTLKCDEFAIDFSDNVELHTYELFEDENGFYAYFPIPKSQKYLMQLSYAKSAYEAKLIRLQKSILWSFAFIVIILALVAVAFSLYALYPLKQALELTQEFIKDILHDFNTPLASLRLNASMLQKEHPENEKILRIEQSITAVLALQEHLRSYLNNHTLQRELFSLDEILKTSVAMVEKNYPDIRFSLQTQETKVLSNKEALIRIIENILTNAAKYNKPNGTVFIELKDAKLSIKDSGKGIKNPTKIFERFYKEQERGLGIGLHIVKKLCDELTIALDVQSQLGVGSTFTLNLKTILYRHAS